MAKKELPPFAEFFGEVDDPRRQNANQRHELIELIVMAVVGTRVHYKSGDALTHLRIQRHASLQLPR